MQFKDALSINTVNTDRRNADMIGSIERNLFWCDGFWNSVSINQDV